MAIVHIVLFKLKESLSQDERTEVSFHVPLLAHVLRIGLMISFAMICFL